MAASAGEDWEVDADAGVVPALALVHGPEATAGASTDAADDQWARRTATTQPNGDLAEHNRRVWAQAYGHGSRLTPPPPRAVDARDSRAVVGSSAGDEGTRSRSQQHGDCGGAGCGRGRRDNTPVRARHPRAQAADVHLHQQQQ